MQVLQQFTGFSVIYPAAFPQYVFRIGSHFFFVKKFDNPGRMVRPAARRLKISTRYRTNHRTAYAMKKSVVGNTAEAALIS